MPLASFEVPSAQMTKLLQITVTGKVQGVAYRVSAVALANKLNLTGFITNHPDGSVYIEIQGKRSDLKEFIDWCHHGPKFARVDQLTTKPLKSLSQPVNNQFLIF